MFDMHSHILPAIDDGAKDLETSLAMLAIAYRNKTSHITATPHVIEGKWLPDWKEIVKKCELLQKEAEKKEIKIQIHPGAEVAMHWDILQIIIKPGPYCLNGGNYLLVELPAMEIPAFADDFFFTLQSRGVRPILAHPERHPEIIKQPYILANWLNKGILAQVNATSLTGKMGEKVKHTAELLISNRMVHILGSDAHTTRTRNPDLTSAVQIINNLMGKDYTRKLVYDHPQSVLAGKEIVINQINKIAEKKKSKNIFMRLMRLCKYKYAE